MKIFLLITRWYLNVLGVVAPKKAGKKAVEIFSKVRLKTIKEKEMPFYEMGKHFTVATKYEDLNCYELGNPNGKLLFLVHGWESNAGSLTQFAKAFESEYRIISFDLPSHARNEEESTNLFFCKEAFKSLIAYINPQEPFSIVSHSFGSSVSSMALSESGKKADKLVFLTANNHIEQVFIDFQNLVGFSDKVYKELNNVARDIIDMDLSEIIIADYLKKANFNSLLLVHDTEDKIINFSNAEEIHAAIPNSSIKKFFKIGHYRMLWNEEVLQTTIDFLKK